MARAIWICCGRSKWATTTTDYRMLHITQHFVPKDNGVYSPVIGALFTRREATTKRPPKKMGTKGPTHKAQARGGLFPDVILLVVGSLVTVTASGSSLKCELYIAESTIPNAGLGLFSAVEKKEGDNLGNGDVAFPLLDLTFYNNERGGGVNPHRFDPFIDYIWDGNTMGMGMEVEESGAVTTLWPGLDCVINSLIPLVNVHRAFPQHNSHGDPLRYMPHRAKHPAAGSITTYRSATAYAKRAIPAGGELFKSYGDLWFESRPHYFDPGFPLSDNFPHAQRLINTYAERFDFPPLYDLMLDLRDIWKLSRTMNALPSNMDDLQTALEKDINYIYQANATRDLDWLQEHGTCVDHIVPSASTIDGVGEGAFAKRNLPSGTIVSGSPLMIIRDEKLLFMYEKELNQNLSKSSPSFVTQVLYNYCLGHEDSTLLLFPYGAIGAQYLNHNPTNPNVILQWADNGKLSHNSTLLELTPEEIDENVWRPSLGIEYVATRDIMEGEELFIDYGDTWDTAWQSHVHNWKPPVEDTIAADWNNEKSHEPIRTQKEQKINPYPGNIQLRCHVNLLEPDWQSQNYGWTRYGAYGKEFFDVYGVPCACLERSWNNASYIVEISVDHLTYFSEQDGDVEIRRTGVPREAMFFLDAAKQSDLYLETAFRHHIRIPDHMMPDAWKNRDIVKQALPQNSEL